MSENDLGVVSVAIFAFTRFAFVALRGRSGPDGRPAAESSQKFSRRRPNITYFFPAHFEPVTEQPSNATDCATTTLVADSAIPAGPSSFVLSRIDATCPVLLRKAAALGPFTRVQLLSQLKQFGEAKISHEPTRYMIDGRPAAITLGSVSTMPAGHHSGKTIYAAKACALSDIPSGGHKRSDTVDPASRVLCFDFSTENSDLISMMFAFIIQFDDDPPAPLFPGSVHPGYWETGGRKP
jgi:hypothetical protein